MKVQQLFEQGRINELKEHSVASKLIIPKIEKSDSPKPAEFVNTSQLEVEFDDAIEGEELENYELLDEEEIATEFEQLEEDIEEQPEEILVEQEQEVLLDIDETAYSDDEEIHCRSNFEIEALELHESIIPSQSDLDISESKRKSSVSLNLTDGSDGTDSCTKFKRNSVKKKRRVKSNIKRDEKEIYRSLLKKCETCGKLVERNRLEGHVNRHANIRPYECAVPDCGIKFHCKIALRLHTQGRHSDKRLPCDLCGKVYSSTKTLYHHKKETHSEKRFKCELCGLYFVSK